MDDSEAMLGRLLQLKRLGVRLAIDDFGTGYSSLSYLQQLSFDILMIDRSFVEWLERGAEERALVRKIIAIGETFGMASATSGIERQGQGELLLGAGLFGGSGVPVRHAPARRGPHQDAAARLPLPDPTVTATALA